MYADGKNDLPKRDADYRGVQTASNALVEVQFGCVFGAGCSGGKCWFRAKSFEFLIARFLVDITKH